MKLYELIDESKRLLDKNDIAKRLYDEDPENAEAEKAFGETYKAFFNAYMAAVNYIVGITGRKVDFNQAKKLVSVKLDEMQEKSLSTSRV